MDVPDTIKLSMMMLNNTRQMRELFVNKEEIVEICTPKPQNTIIDVTPSPTIEDVCDMVTGEFTVLRDSKGVIHDGATIVIKCKFGHVHKYYTKDIIEKSGLKSCLTCGTGSAFNKLVRDTAEKLLGVPFCITQHGANIAYVQHQLKLLLVCKIKDIGDEVKPNYLIINISRTISADKIRKILRGWLKDYEKLTDAQREKINVGRKFGNNNVINNVINNGNNIAKLPPVNKKKNVPSKKPAFNPQGPLPYCEQLRETVPSSFIIDDELLLLENC